MLEKKIEGTKDTPAIIFSQEKKQLTMSGYSYPENPVEFYRPVIELIDNFLANIDEEKIFNITLQLSYFNSSSSKILIDIFDKLERIAMDGYTMNVNWMYRTGDESIEEYGSDFKEGLEYVNFNLIEIPIAPET